MNRFANFTVEERSFLATCLQMPTLSLSVRERELKKTLQDEVHTNPFHGGGPIGYGVWVESFGVSYQL
jgi:hypothetical protein